ncbi:inositol monophosphatase family protein [Pseudalkalibacillus sp. R45]|uniref:inositol monophosphatase family protein n=1 Tax=Pseudalkalibacillus sp. R45 TaxID=3457433 RepID=UPI003FCC796F
MNQKANEWANFAEKVVRNAGKRVVEIREEGIVDKMFKNDGELVTSADLESDKIIREAITQCYPEHRILSEESRVNGWGDITFDGPLWIIDPLGGTVNYANNLPHFGISIAIAFDGIVWAGAVYAPDLNCTYVGIRNQGAYCNGELLKICNSPESITDAIIGTGFPHNKNDLKSALSRVNILSTNCRDIRRFAAPTIDICYVASGKLHGHTESLAPWDVAASGLIAREAGALTGHVNAVPDGIPIELYGDDVLFSAPNIFIDLLHLLRLPNTKEP